MSLPPERKKRPGTKITGGLVALSSAAIVTVYAAGYAQTQQAAAQLDAPIATTSAPPTARIATATTAPTSTPFQPIRISPAFTAPTTAPLPRTTPTPAGSATPARVAGASGTYRDGSYTGLGRSRHGNIEVTVA